MGVVYGIKNTITNQYYIGVTIQEFNKRKQQHFLKLRKNIHPNAKLQNAWNKYGEENFTFIIIEENIAETILYDKEITYIKEYKSFEMGYNLTRGGDRGCSEWLEKKVYVYTLQGDYVKEYSSKAQAERELDCHSIKECCLGGCNRGYSKTDGVWYQYSYEYKEQIQPWMSSTHLSKEFLKISNTQQILETYHSVSYAAQANNITAVSHLREAAKNHTLFHGYYWAYKENYDADTWTPKDTNKIIAYKDGVEVGRYVSANAASKALGVDNSSISKVLKGTRKSAGGYVFKNIEVLK